MKLRVAKIENTATITIFGKLGLTASGEDHRRVLAVLRFLEA